MLTQEGYDVAQAPNGEAGLAMVAQQHFDIILLDLMMPGISGMEALEQIRALHPDTVCDCHNGVCHLRPRSGRHETGGL